MYSICLTVFNEEATIAEAIKVLVPQLQSNDEIVIVDGGSTDNTVVIIKKFQKKEKRIKLLVEKCSRSHGRNLSVELSKNDIIAMTDAGCVANHDWLKLITEPFKNPKIDIIAGFYEMVGRNAFEKAESVYLGVLPQNFNGRFLPSTRSVAFRRSAYERVGGFLEGLSDTAEDTVFNIKAIEESLNISRVKSAIVKWGMPGSMGEFSKKLESYAKGDAKSKVWKHPLPNYTSHNIRVLKLITRYFLGLLLVFLTLTNPLFGFLTVLIFIFYSFWAFRKSFFYYHEIKVGLWGIVLQFVSDYSVIKGFIIGTFV